MIIYSKSHTVQVKNSFFFTSGRDNLKWILICLYFWPSQLECTYSSDFMLSVTICDFFIDYYESR